MELPPVKYQGRWWDAPFTDDAVQADLSGRDCEYCREPITQDDDAVWQPYVLGHLECHLRSALGDVQHLEGRCICSGGPAERDNSNATYREEAKATLQWLLDNR